MIILTPTHLLPVGFGSFVEMLRLELLHWPDAGAFSTNFHDQIYYRTHSCLLSKSELFVSRTVETIGVKPGSEPRLLTFFKTVTSIGCTVYKTLEELIFTKQQICVLRIATCWLLRHCTMGTEVNTCYRTC
jgi:hypothetical protein